MEFPIPVVLVTHDLSEACTLAYKLIVYANGRVVQIGTPSHVLSFPTGPDVELLVSTRRVPLHTASHPRS